MRNHKLTLVSCALSVMLATASIQANAGIQSQMDEVFGIMSNFTQPGAFNTQRRGILSGGGLQARNPITSSQLLSLQLPSVRAGCGGIDIFAGSFSFISADQFVQFLRSIASNAAGYAFKVALEAGCSVCANVMDTLQAVSQAMNNTNMNSCQLAQGIVNDVSSSALGYNIQHGASLMEMGRGIYEDFSAALKAGEGDGPYDHTDKLSDQDKEAIQGNIMWQNLVKNNSKQAIPSPGSDRDEYGEMMALTGTIIITEPKTNEEGNKAPNVTSLASIMRLQDIVEGGDNINVYECNDDKCESPTIKQKTVVGLYSRFRTALLGDAGDGSAGLVAKFGQNANNGLTNLEMAVMTNLTGAAGAMIRNVSTAKISEVSFVDQLAYAVAMAHAHDYALDLLRIAESALSTSKAKNASEMKKMLAQRRIEISNDYDALAKGHPTIAQLTVTYNELIKNVPHLSLSASRATPSKD